MKGFVDHSIMVVDGLRVRPRIIVGARQLRTRTLRLEYDSGGKYLTCDASHERLKAFVRSVTPVRPARGTVEHA